VGRPWSKKKKNLEPSNLLRKRGWFMPNKKRKGTKKKYEVILGKKTSKEKKDTAPRPEKRKTDHE